QLLNLLHGGGDLLRQDVVHLVMDEISPLPSDRNELPDLFVFLFGSQSHSSGSLDFRHENSRLLWLSTSFRAASTACRLPSEVARGRSRPAPSDSGSPHEHTPQRAAAPHTPGAVANTKRMSPLDRKE